MTEDRIARLKQLMQRKGISQAELARLAGCSQPTLSQILSGAGFLGEKLAAKLAPHLGTTVPGLLYGIERPRGPEEQGDVLLSAMEGINEYERPIRLAVEGWAAADAGLKVPWKTEPEGYVELRRNKIQILKVAGGSMAPVLWDGQMVGVDWEAEPDNGDLACVELRDGRVFVKRFWRNADGSVSLQSTRPLPPDRAVRPEPDLKVPRSKIKRSGRVWLHILYKE